MIIIQFGMNRPLVKFQQKSVIKIHQAHCMEKLYAAKK